VKWEYFLETRQAIRKLKTDGYKIFAVEQVENSMKLENFQDDHCEKVAMVFGHEVKGVGQEIVNMSDVCIEIPQYGTKHSLNISVCAGIVLWEVYKKFVKTL
jgi:tRNA G18 (ribose-2'-O)-methylase SpoU